MVTDLQDLRRGSASSPSHLSGDTLDRDRAQDVAAETSEPSDLGALSKVLEHLHCCLGVLIRNEELHTPDSAVHADADPDNH